MHLKILGRASKKIVNTYTSILNYTPTDESEMLLFFDFSEDNVAVGHEFYVIENMKNEILFSGLIKLISVSQEFGKPFDSIPAGWKTICKIKFIGKKVPSVVLDLPPVNDWFESKEFLILK